MWSSGVSPTLGLRMYVLHFPASTIPIAGLEYGMEWWNGIEW